MNYISEINNFYDWLETNPISDSAIVLWHALMHVNNKCGWKPEFTVAISTIQNKTGLSSSSILRARKVLVEVGRIHFKSRGGQQSAIYTMIGRHSDAQSEQQSSTLSQIPAIINEVVSHGDEQSEALTPVVGQCDAQSGEQSEGLKSFDRHSDAQSEHITKLNYITKKGKPFFKIAGELFEMSPSERINSDHSYSTDTFMTGIFRGLQKEEILKRLDAEYMGYEFRDEMHLRNSFKTIGEKIKTENKPKPTFFKKELPVETGSSEGYVFGSKPRGAVKHG